MLDALRRGAQSWVAKILFGILVVSFAIWGVADVFRGFGQGSLAKVGPEEITTNEFQIAYQNRLYAIGRQIGQRLTPEQARAIGLPNQVLSGLIGAAAIDVHAKDLNLALSDAALAEDIRADPGFKGVDGRFSRLSFESFLHQIGMSEQGFIALRRREQIREQITKAVREAVVVSRPMIDLIHAWREETRTLEHMTIDADKAVSIAEPDEARLRETYEQNKREFVTPEYRKISVLLLSVEEVKDKVTVTEEEIKAAYEQDKDRYDTPERRRIQQIAFPDKAAAEAARQAIAGGKSFIDVAKENGASESDIDLGVLSKRQMIDKKIADIAFALEKDKISDVVEGQFATVLLRVTEIQPGKTVTFDEVKPRVRDTLAREKAAREIPKLHDEVEDGLAAGKSLKEIAESLNLRYIEADEVDRENKTSDKTIVIDVPDGLAIVNAAFEATPGIEHPPVELSDGGAAWVDVRGVTEERQRPFDEVKAEVKDLYMKNERRRALSELATKLVQRINDGTPLAKLAEEVGGKPETTDPITRSTVPQGLTQAAVTQAFALPEGQAGSAETSDGRSRVVFKVVTVKPAPPPTQEQVERISNELRQQMGNDVLTEYVAGLQKEYGVRINETALRRAVGGGDETQ